MKKGFTSEDGICLMLAISLSAAGVLRHRTAGDEWVPVLFGLAVFFLICALRHWRTWGQ